MSEKEIIGALSVAAGLASYGIYLWGVWRGGIKPHVFTWLIWALVLSIGFAVQHVEHAGPGSWNLGMSAIVTLVISIVGYFYGEKNITRSDWAAFIIALLAIPAWLLTANPLWAVIIISIIDGVAFYPTFRKSWVMPHEESASSFFVGMFQFFLSAAALEKMTLVTLLYPVTIVFLNMSLVVVLLWRRRMV